MSHRTLAAAFGFWLALGARAQSAPFQNGSFESPQVSVASGLNFAFGTDPLVSVPGWTSTTNGTGSSENFLYGTSTTGYSDGVSAGQQAILVNGDGSVTTTLAQTFDTHAGEPYTVLFDLGIQSTASPGTTAPISLLASGGTSDNYTVTAVGAVNTIHPFTTETYMFTPTSNSTTLTFTQVGGGGDSPLLDNVRISFTPEPGSLCLFVLGALGLLLVQYRTRRLHRTT